MSHKKRQRYHVMEIYTDEQVDNYLQDKMSYADKEAFEKKLACNPDLQSKLILRKLIIESLKHNAEKEEKAAAANARGRQITRRTILAIGFVFALIFLLGTSHKYSTQDIYDEYYFIPYFEYTQNKIALSAEDASTNNELMALYMQKAYAKMVSLYQQKWGQKDITQFPPSTLLNVCISAMQTNQAEQAIPVLERMHHPDYQEKADWLLLFCYLKEGYRSDAMNVASEIIKRGNRLSDKAYEINNKLGESKWFSFDDLR